MPQAVLPEIAHELAISPASASLTVSVTTGALAVAVIPVSTLSEVVGRRPIMLAALVGATLLGLCVAVVPSYELLLVVRTLQGVALAGLPAVALAYLVDEVPRGSLGRAVGSWVGGTTIGGLVGRVLPSLVSDVGGWRWGMAAVGVMAVAATLIFWLTLPRPTGFRPRQARIRPLAATLFGHLADPRLRRMYLVGFGIMAAFVSTYNYLTFRLAAPPFDLPPAAIGLLFLCYLMGTVASFVAGRLSDLLTRRIVLGSSLVVALAGLALTLPDSLPVLIGGVAVFTLGYFGAHVVASGWTSASARTAPAQASALYTLGYYAGSSVGGWAGGFPYAHWGWPGAATFAAVMIGVALGAGVLPLIGGREGPRGGRRA
ncbi:MAG: MFS transporter [Streptosporangiales bacterium]|nr:MFS transporter [Streptosporangiales bacterium]